jgi:type VI secretion system protein ImpM
MSHDSEQYGFGYFGKIPTLGDFIHHVLPQDFANGFHSWLQHSMANAREHLGDQFLTYYLNCPAWKFLMAAGVCGAQPVVGLTIPSVDRVGRYFNFTLATVLPMDSNPFAYALSNRSGLKSLEILALDILEQDFTREQMDIAIQEITQQFVAAPEVRNSVRSGDNYIQVTLDRPLPLADQASTLINHLLSGQMGTYSAWWYGLEGQSNSNLAVCGGLPSTDLYLELLTLRTQPEAAEKSRDFIDIILAEDA